MGNPLVQTQVRTVPVSSKAGTFSERGPSFPPRLGPFSFGRAQIQTRPPAHAVKEKAAAGELGPWILRARQEARGAKSDSLP
jgi:hypothetical protein